MTEPGGGFPLPTDTAHVRIESRQYRLFKLDLGEGIPRVTLKVGAAVFAPWFGLCWLVGIPMVSGLLFWLMPPVLITWRAMSRDEGGRLRLVAWGDRLSWISRRHRPIVNAGTTSPLPPQPIRTDLSFVTIDLDAPTPGVRTRRGRRRAQQDQAA